MKRGSKILISVLSFLFIFLLFDSCKKSYNELNTDGKGTFGETTNRTGLQVRLKDRPDPNVKEVWVDIKDVMISMNDTGKWMSLSGTHPGLYNLLELTNGNDTLLSDADIPAGTISQIRLILGNGNYIVTKDDKQHNLTTPSAQQSGLKVKVNKEVAGGLYYRLVLDFDAGESIVKAGNSGMYILKPVLTLASFESVPPPPPTEGDVKGVVLPDSVSTSVFAVLGTDTTGNTTTDTAGNYMFQALTAGDYVFHYNPGDTTFKDTTLNVTVIAGQLTTVDTLTLVKK